MGKFENPIAVLVTGLVILFMIFGSVVAFADEPTDIKPDFSIHDTDIKVAEAFWQGLHAVDVATTIKGAGDRCYKESDPITKHITGEHPTTAGVVGWGVVYATLHYIVSAELSEHDAPKWMQWTWQALNIEGTGQAVINNFRVGIRFGSPNVHPGCRS